MQCSVPNCFNLKKKNPKNITFHALPKEPNLRKKWLNVINGNNLRCKIYVCSEHFNVNDFDGHQLKLDAVPSLIQVCRICLAADTKLFDMSGRLTQSYKQITGLMINSEDGYPQKLCWECQHKLLSCTQLRDKATRSYFLMEDLLVATNYLTTEIITKTIDRQTHKLTSNLTTKYFDVNYNDLHLHESNIQNDVIENFTQINEIEETSENIDDIKEEAEFTAYDDYDNGNDEAVSSSDEILAKRVKKKSKIKKEKVDKRKKPAHEVLNLEIFDINKLTIDEQVLEIRNRQESSNFKNSEFKCMECYKGFIDKDAYENHMTRHTDKSGVFVCDICKIHFRSRHYVAGHATQAHMYKFICKRCPFVTPRRHAAKLHEKYHNGTRYVCSHCLEVFVKFSTYLTHLRLKHPTDNVCQLCGHSFVSDKGLKLHVRLKHRFDDRPVPAEGPKCEKCNISFVSEEALTNHEKLSTKHNDQQNAKPIYRRKPREPREIEAEDSKNLKSTEKKPSGPISCEQCDMQLPDSLSYYRHFRRAHPDKNRTNYPSMPTKCMCEVCGRMFQSLALLQDHSWTHTEDKQFKCSQCNKTFQRKYRLIAHQKVHGAQRRRYACSVCGKMFSTMGNMQRHMFSHTGLRPFKCEMCGKCFKHVGEKRTHIAYVHLKKPWPKRTRERRRTDGRTVQQPDQSTSDMVQPLWRDDKIDDVDKEMYYDVKI